MLLSWEFIAEIMLIVWKNCGINYGKSLALGNLIH
jgi:hypothetical protein